MFDFNSFRENLLESSFSRLMKKMENQDIGVITAFRDCYSKAKNRKRNKMLEADLKASGFSHYKGLGRYIEGYGSENPSAPSDEEVYIVFSGGGEENDKRLLDALKKLGYKYNQDSILYKYGGQPDAYLFRTQDVDRDCNVGNKIDWPSKDGTNMGAFRIRGGMFQTMFKGKELSAVPDSDE